MTHTTRETWLTELADLLRQEFDAAGSPLPEKIRLSCGFCSTGAASQRIGECWHAESSGDGTVEILIRPDQAEAMTVAAIVLHELCHAALGKDAKHGPEFKKLATAMGLTGKMTATTAGDVAVAMLTPIVEHLGAYPHSALTLKQPKKVTNEPWKSVKCGDDEGGFTATQTLASLEEGLRLKCPHCGDILMTKEERAAGQLLYESQFTDEGDDPDQDEDSSDEFEGEE